MVKAFLASNSQAYKVNPAVAGYESFDNQAAALGESRAYRKLVIRTESLHQKGLKVKEKYFFSNFATRDLVQISSVSIFVQLLKPLLNALIVALEVLVHELTKQTFEQPPPVKSSLIKDINLSPRLLPAPTVASV